MRYYIAYHDTDGNFAIEQDVPTVEAARTEIAANPLMGTVFGFAIIWDTHDSDGAIDTIFA